MDELFVNPYLLKISLFGVFSSAVLVVVYAVLSAKAIGGKLGYGLKLVSAGVICYMSLFLTLIVLEQETGAFLSPEQIRIFFLFTSIFGSSLLIVGFWKIYRIGKELKLFY
jgi:hypothetical protein